MSCQGYRSPREGGGLPAAQMDAAEELRKRFLGGQSGAAGGGGLQQRHTGMRGRL